MKKTFLIVAGILGPILLIVGFLVATYISHSNQANRLEKSVTASTRDREATLAGYGQKILEAAQVPELAKDRLKETITAAIQGRYGANGSQALFQSIQEVNPSTDPVLDRNMQRMIDAGRNEFDQKNRIVASKCAVYEVALDNVWSGFWIRTAGWPKIDIKKVCEPISTDRAQEAVRNGKESGPLQLSPSKQ